MPRLDVVRESKIIKTPRLMQLEGIFDVPPSEKSAENWCIDFELPETWNVGLIVGPSGSGKSTIAHELFGDSLVSGFEWSKEKWRQYSNIKKIRPYVR
jgi:ABC-type protease/lipase transport system fused ATPase/permease subunit